MTNLSIAGLSTFSLSLGRGSSSSATPSACKLVSVTVLALTSLPSPSTTSLKGYAIPSRVGLVERVSLCGMMVGGELALDAEDARTVRSSFSSGVVAGVTSAYPGVSGVRSSRSSISAPAWPRSVTVLCREREREQDSLAARRPRRAERVEEEPWPDFGTGFGLV